MNWLSPATWFILVGGFVFLGYWIGSAPYRQLVDWWGELQEAEDLLPRLQADTATSVKRRLQVRVEQPLDDLTALANLADEVTTPEVAEPLNEAAELHRSLESVINQVRVAYWSRFRTSDALAAALLDLEHDLSQTKVELQQARLTALSAPRELLERATPDIRERLSGLPLQVPALAYALASLIAVVWICGYYGVIGMRVWPFLRSFDDVLLIGFTSGLLPFLAFLFVAFLAMWTLNRTRSGINDPKAGANAIARALRTAQHILKPQFWIRRALIIFALLWSASVIAGLLIVQVALNEKIIATKNGSVAGGPVSIVGAVGQFAVLTDGKVRQSLAIPMESVTCIKTPKWPEEKACKQSSDEEPPVTMQPVEVRVSPVKLEDGDWQLFVKRVAQCNVVKDVKADDSDDQPLLLPAFRDDEKNVFDKEYYDRWPSKWPFGGSQYWKNSHHHDQRALWAQVAESTVRKVEEWVNNNNENKNRKTNSLNVIGFASGTNTPAYNQRIAVERAMYAACQITKQLKSKNIPVCSSRLVCNDSCSDCTDSRQAKGDAPEACLDIRFWGFGEMQDHTWMGRQGDVSERTVLVAACDKDMF